MQPPCLWRMIHRAAAGLKPADHAGIRDLQRSGSRFPCMQARTRTRSRYTRYKIAHGYLWIRTRRASRWIFAKMAGCLRIRSKAPFNRG